MRRYTSLLLTAFTLVLFVVAGSVYLAGYADKTDDHKVRQSITVYTTLPAEHAALLAQEYEKANKVRVDFVPLDKDELLQRLKEQAAEPGKAPADLVLADSSVLRLAAQYQYIVPYVSEQADSVADTFKDAAGCWTGIWYDPYVFCVNRDYLRLLPHIPQTWKELAGLYNVRIGLTDFLAARASADLFFALISQYGEQEVFDMLRQLHPRVVQYSKYLSTPVRMAGMGEVDISIAVQSETLRYINDGYPLKIIYPEDGTAYTLTGTAIPQNAAHKAAAGAFADWLLGDEAQLVLQKNGFFFVPVNPATLAYKTFAGKNIKLFEKRTDFSAQQRQMLLDSWVKNIRLK
jgi:iron(III) transport system substrate-binding protein